VPADKVGVVVYAAVAVVGKAAVPEFVLITITGIRFTVVLFIVAVLLVTFTAVGTWPSQYG
jgi:hypothetical protein